MTDVVSALVGKVVDILFGVAKTEITYIWNCSENVKNLKNEIEKLSSMKGRVQQQIDLAHSKGEILLEGVEEWMKKADSEIPDAKKFIAEEAEVKKTCLNLRFCVNLSTVRQFSKRATKRTSSLQQHQIDGKDFETCVSLPAPTPGFTDLYRRKSIENIDTQKSTLKEIIEAIEDDKIQIVGINGLGGVGKTTLASEVAAEMKNRFAEIVFVTVSQTVNYDMIQKKVETAASRIINGEKVLIILDDVWEELKLEEAGIPCGSDNMKYCKILVTSRSKDVCEAMNAQKNISVNPLQDEEAWTLFERVVGRSKWDGKLKEVAVNIVKECGGLPLFIQAVGKALKNKEYKSWEATLDRLQDPTDDDALFKRNGIMQLKLSYDYLESEVAKSCFLLCSMFPEDGIIGFKKLTYYCLGLGIFNDYDISIQGAEYRVQLAVDSLKSSFLLLHEDKEEGEEQFKMHDLVRDMARLITSKRNDKFFVESGRGLTKWQPKKYLESYKKISLMNNDIDELHDHDCVFPHLDTFLIQDNDISSIHDEFFRGMEKLKVLDMSGNDMLSSLPQSLKKLTLLRMLDLSRNYSLNEISILGELTCLVILKLRETGVTNIPKEIGQLTNLRLLDVYECEALSYVTPGVISKLIELEELYVGLSESTCDFLLELNESLKILHLKVPELHCIPEDFRCETLMGFLIEDDFQWGDPVYDCKRILRLSKSSFPTFLTMQVMRLMQASECLILRSIEEMDNVLQYLCDKLKYIQVTDCHNVRSLVETYDLDVKQTSDGLGQKKVFSQVENIMLYSLGRLEVIWDRPLQYISFCNLTSFRIYSCHCLLTLFPLSVAQGLVNLRDIDIGHCGSLSAVISAGDELTTGREIESVDTNIILPLTNIKLYDLPSLDSFYSGHSIIKYPSLKNLRVEYCPSMKRWSYGENHIPKIRFEHERRQYSNINEYINEVQHETHGNLIIGEWS